MELKKQDDVKEIIDYTITKVLDAIKGTYLGTVNQAVFKTLNDSMFVTRVADELYCRNILQGKTFGCDGVQMFF